MASKLLRRGRCAATAMVALMIAPIAQASATELTSEAVATVGAGHFLWNGTASEPVRPSTVRIVVSIADQKMYVYRGAKLFAVSAVSTGKPGHDTPTGDFKILQKQVKHKSSLYEDASMPYMQRITWDGVAIHAGRDPGYAASHGCVRVPIAFAKRLYGITSLGARVTITDDSVADLVPSAAPAPAADPLALDLPAAAEAATETTPAP